MPRDHARMNLAIWDDADFRALPPAAQHLYMVLWTAPDLSYCGVTEWRPGRISARAADWSAEAISAAASILVDRDFLVVDLDTEEALIRSWIRWDGLMGQPIMAVSMANARAAVASNLIRGVVVHELQKLRAREPDLKGWSKRQVQDMLEQPGLDSKGLPNPLANPSVNPPRNPSPNPPSKGYGGGGPNPSANPPSTPAPAPAPLLQLPAKSAAAAEIGGSAEIVSEWIESCKVRPVRKVIGQIREQVQNLIEEEVPPERIRAGLRHWQQRGNLGPSLLPNIVHEIANQPAPGLDEHDPHDWMNERVTGPYA